MLTAYVNAAMRRARYEVLSDGTHFGRIPGLQGVWADARTRRACQKELQEVLEDWLVLKLRDRDPVPRINGIALVPSRVPRRQGRGRSVGRSGSTMQAPRARTAAGASRRRVAKARF